MTARVVACPECRRVVAVGAGLPASCLNAVPPEERGALSRTAAAVDPRIHRDCVELELVVAEKLEGEALLAEVERVYGAQLGALGELVRYVEPAT